MRILGISALDKESTATLVQDGKNNSGNFRGEINQGKATIVVSIQKLRKNISNMT
jgi:hypothetical protein